MEGREVENTEGEKEEKIKCVCIACACFEAYKPIHLNNHLYTEYRTLDVANELLVIL